MKERWKKLTSLTLTSALLASAALTGCGSDSGSQGQPESSTAGGGAGGETENKGNDNQSVEMRTVSVLGRDMNNSGRPWWNVENYHDWEAGKVFDAKMEELGIVLEVETVSNDQYDEAVKTRQDAWLDMPDVILASGTTSDWVGYGKAGNTWNIKELLEQYDADGSIWAYMEQVGGDAFKTLLDENGNLWWFPYILNQGVNGRPGSAFTISIRADWLEAIDEEYKYFYTPEELLDVLVKFREQDANGNGVADEVINFNPASEWEPISSAFGIGMKYIYALSDGSGVQCKLDHEEFPAFIEYCQKLYQEGVFNTEILNAGSNILESNRASAIFDYCGATYNEPMIAGCEETARYAPAIIDNDAGVDGYLLPSCDSPHMAIKGWLINKECADPQAVVDLMDFVYSDEGSDLSYWGVEGVSWQYNTEMNGKEFIDASTLYAEEDTSRSPLNNVVFSNIIPSALNIEKSVAEWIASELTSYPEKNEFLIEVLQEANERDIPYISMTEPYAMMTETETGEYNAVAPTVETYISELITDLIIGKKSLEDLESYRAEVGGLGLDKMIEIRKAQYERYQNQ